MFFVRRVYHVEKLGPFDTVDEAKAFINNKVAEDFYWDYDGAQIGQWDDYPEPLNLYIMT